MRARGTARGRTVLSKLKGMELFDQRYIEYGMKMGDLRLNRIGSAVVVMVSVDGPMLGDPGIAKTYSSRRPRLS
ncbi:hypothetical protein VCV18_007498 [Metarhizium anisopliae]